MCVNITLIQEKKTKQCYYFMPGSTKPATNINKIKFAQHQSIICHYYLSRLVTLFSENLKSILLI